MVQYLTGDVLALLIGLSLGLIGGGGSILTVPVLVYVMGINPVISTAYSLFIVGSTSLVGAADYAKKDLIDFRTAAVFALPSFLAVFLVRKFVVPAIPDVLFSIQGFVLTRETGLMVLFALIMLGAAASMIYSRTSVEQTGTLSFNYPMIMLEGLIVGAVTGLVGAGGGFLIIPALVLLANLPIKKAVGTSLLIIAVKSLFGFLGDVMNMPTIDWQLLLNFTLFATIGIFTGSYLSKYVAPASLKKGFGWFLVIMAGYILTKELWIN
ncbi:MAG: sulfite exporter TauE/SafE family protein [Bacteroidetes Order II. Incertae sedis bacterium]|nr:sulfite exporter TauE/SafE family protein [Bacteroidetes Order II. bacterium]